MSDISEVQIQPVPPVGGTAAVQSAPLDRPATLPEQHSALPHGGAAASITGGGLPNAYAQITVNPDTHDMVIEVRDSATGQVIRQYPSREIEAMNRDIQQFMERLALRQVARIHNGSAAQTSLG